MLLLMIFLAGVLHGLGPDHLAAITAFGAIAGRSFRRIAFFSIRFAAGHAVVIGAAALLAHVGRVALPVAWERGFDLAAGALLILTGAGLMMGLLTGRLSLHSHSHHHHQGDDHRHFHAHLGSTAQHQHKHGSLAFLLGGLFALGGARSLLLVIPVAIAQTFAMSLLRIALFTMGIVISMAGYGVIAGGVLRRADQTIEPRRQEFFFRLTTTGIALFCVAAGLLTVAERLQV